MKHATNMHTLTGGVGGTLGSVNTEFTKMDSQAYEQYLSAHHRWREVVVKTDDYLHDLALKRRILEKYRETHKNDDFVLVDGPGNRVRAGTYTREIQIYHDQSDGSDVLAEIRTAKKTQHSPTLSTKPHEAEKRQLKHEVSAARTKVQVEALKATKTILVNDQTSANILARQREIKKLKDLAPLHRQEEKAAKSAVSRARAIKFGSSDVVANVDPADGFKVVTRKKGGANNIVQTSYTVETHHDGVSGHPQSWTSWQTTQDPALPNIRKNVSVNPRPRNTGARA